MRVYLTRKGTRIVAPRAHFLESCLPYGKWTCEDGREVLFDRNYSPICQRYPGQAATMAKPTEWVPWKSQTFFYDDGTPMAKKRRITRTVLDEWGMAEAVHAAAKQLASVRVETCDDP
jgi:hypothetical protein